MKIYGASGHGGVILDICITLKRSVEGFIDDATKQNYLGLEVHHPSSIRDNDEMIIAIGDNRIRKEIVGRLLSASFVSVVHSRATISTNVQLGLGTAIMAGVVINQGSSIGNHVILNTNCSVDHDCKIDDFVHISPGATICGGITIGEGTHVGAGATILPNLHIGKNVIIGAGAVVTKNVPPNIKVVGIPAKSI